MPSSSTRTNLYRASSAAALAALLVGGPLSGAAHAAVEVPPLRTASAFSVLAGSTVTNTGATTISRDVGLHPGTAVTGNGSMVVGGTYHVADGVALTAKDHLTAAYVNAADQTPRKASDDELGGEVLTAGIYNRGAGMALTGALTLDGGRTDGGTSDSVWVFQAGSTLTVADAASIVLTGGANPCNVYWQVGSSATLGKTSTFVGTIMALTTITMNDGATLQGRALARNGAVNLNRNVITTPTCAGDTAVAPGTATPPTPTPSPTPAPSAAPVPATPGATGGSAGSGAQSGTQSGSFGAGTFTDNQVKRTPTGSVDTGYVGPVSTERAPVGALGGAAFAIFAALVFAVRGRGRERG